MKLLHTSALHGPNLWAKDSVLEVIVDCRVWKWATWDELQCFEQRLCAWFPDFTACDELQKPRQPESAGLSAATMFLHLVHQLQTISRTPLGVGRAMATDERDIYRLVIPTVEQRLAQACLEVACRCCVAALDGAEFDAPSELTRLEELAQRVCLGWLTGPVVAAAQARGIPFRRLDGESLVQLGHGARQRKVWKSLTDRTGKVAEWISLDKERTKRLLRDLGVPVPWGRTATTAEEAWAVACEIGLPVVIKPCDTDCGIGVCLNLTTRAQVLSAFATAKQFRDVVIVERFVEGEQYRLTIVGERIVAAVRRDSPRLVGDGRHSVAELIELANLDPRRGNASHHTHYLIQAESDTSQVLAEQGLDFDTIPATGADVRLSRLAHAWAGGSVTDVTDEIHPQVAAQCIFAVKMIGLDVAGVDVVTPDIGRPFEAQGGVIVEVNAEPALWLHFPPYCNVRRPVCEAIVESLFPGAATGRIPLVAISGNGDNRAIGRLVSRLLRRRDRRIGRGSSGGLYLNGLRLTSGRQDTLAGTRAVLMNPLVDAAVLERSLASIAQEGLDVDQLDVAIVSRVGDNAFDSPMVQAIRVLIETVRHDGTVILDADDPLLPILAESARANLILISAHGTPERKNLNREPPPRLVYLQDSDLVLRDHDGSEQVIETLDTDVLNLATNQSSKALLFAIAAAWAHHVPLKSIQHQMNLLGRSKVGLTITAMAAANSSLV